MCPNPIFLKQVLLVGYLPEEYEIYNWFLVTVCAAITAAIHFFSINPVGLHSVTAIGDSEMWVA
jgi:hypothetical protein